MTLYNVNSGQTLDNPTLASGDVVNVNAGGFLTNCAISNGAVINLNQDGHVLHPVLENGGLVNIANHTRFAMNNTVFAVGGTVVFTDVTFVSAAPGSGAVGGGDPFVWTLDNVQGSTLVQLPLKIPTGHGNEYYDTAEFVASQVNGTAVRRTA